MFKIGLRTKFIIILLIVSLIPLVILNVTWLNVSEKQNLEINKENLAVATSRVTKEIENFLSPTIHGLNLIAQSEAARQGAISSIRSELELLIEGEPTIIALSYVEDRSHELIRVTSNLPENSPLVESITQNSPYLNTDLTPTGNSIYVSNPYRIHNHSYLDIGVHVPNGEENSSTSASRENFLIARLELHKLWELLSDFSVRRTGYFFLVDRHGTLIFHPSDLIEPGTNLRSLAEVNEHVVITQEGNQQPDHAHETNTLQNQPIDSVITQNEFGQNALTAHGHVDPTDWGVISQISTAEVFFESAQLRLTFFLVLLIVMIFIIILGIPLADQVLYPLKQLTEGTTRFGKGELSHRIKLRTSDELEALSISYNQMASQLQDSFRQIKDDKDQIAAERNKLSQIVLGVTDGIIALDTKRKIILINRAAENMLGLNSTHVIGKSIDLLIKIYDNDHLEIPSELYCPPIKPGLGFEGTVFERQDLQLIVHNQREVFVNLISAQISEAMQADVGCILTIHDVTEEHKLEEMKQDFVTMAAHELRTPLTAIKGYLSLFSKETTSKLDPEQITILQRIEMAAQRLLGLVENLLNVSEIEHGKITLKISQLDWIKTIQESINELSSYAQEKEVAIELIHPEQKLPPVLADPLRIYEVLHNIISNGIKFSSKGGTITISLEVNSTENNLITTIRDTGPGIPKESIPHLFTKFFRVTSGDFSSIPERGIGLGLYISKKVLELHNGKIWVESAEGQGTTFSFSLPIATQQLKPTK